jgi:hypothetical protein
MTLLDRVLKHCRSFVQREIVDYMASPPTPQLAYAVGVLVGERESHWFAPDVVRVAGVARRESLLAEYPDAPTEVVWNVAAFDLAEWPLVPHMLSPGMVRGG